MVLALQAWETTVGQVAGRAGACADSALAKRLHTPAPVCVASLSARRGWDCSVPVSHMRVRQRGPAWPCLPGPACSGQDLKAGVHDSVPWPLLAGAEAARTPPTPGTFGVLGTRPGGAGWGGLLSRGPELFVCLPSYKCFIGSPSLFRSLLLFFKFEITASSWQSLRGELFYYFF